MITITLLPTHSPSHLNTWPYHFKLLSCTFWKISPTFAIPVIFPFLILSSLVTQIIHLNTIISAIYCDLFTAHVGPPTLVFARVHVRFFIHIMYCHYILIWQSILPIAPLDFLTRHSIVRLPCFAIRCRTANIASAIPLPGIKPNCASLSLLSIILSKIVKVYQLHPSAVPTIVDVSLLYINWYNQTISPLRWYILLLVYTLRQIDNMSIPSSPKHIHTYSGIPSLSVVLPFFIRDNVTLQYLIPTDSLS